MNPAQEPFIATLNLMNPTQESLTTTLNLMRPALHPFRRKELRITA